MRLPTAWSLCVLAAFAVAAFWLDSATTAWFLQNSARGLKTAASWISNVFDWPWLCVTGLVFLFAAVRASQTRAARVILLMILASSLSGIASNTIKSVTGRTRPNMTKVEQGWYGMKRGEEWLIGKNKFNSFPSSHTACAVAFFLPLFELGLLPGIIGVLCAAVVAWARLQLGVHYLSDVSWAAVVGLIAAWSIETQRRRLECWANFLCLKFSASGRPQASAPGIETGPSIDG